MGRKSKMSRPLKKRVFLLLTQMHIKISNLSFARWCIFIGTILLFFSLFLPWFSLTHNEVLYGAFSQLLGIHGILIILCVMCNVYALFFQMKKKKIQLQLQYSFRDTSMFIISSLILGITLVGSLNSVSGLLVFSSEIHYHSGLTIVSLSTLLIILGSIFVYNAKKKGSSIYMNYGNVGKNMYNEEEHNTTKLPF